MHVNHTRSSVNVPIWITRCRILSAIEKGGLSRVAQRKFQSRTQCHFGSLLTVWSPNNECLFGQRRSCMGNYYGHYLRYLATKPLTRSQNDPGLEIAKVFPFDPSLSPIHPCFVFVNVCCIYFPFFLSVPLSKHRDYYHVFDSSVKSPTAWWAEKGSEILPTNNKESHLKGWSFQKIVQETLFRKVGCIGLRE